ncbi:S-adenosyl-L-methionine-dependent methyltransferase [Lecanosticta acicola]|uniref:S-adenosyl-L-methionine-dependent methyltransferase n=1 Tax=Lecanosticta acicola TaxID=111012 RepID=A0AAI8Z9I7_9PEZI|nr:S-adenosyl-L-methionine-dependent methyltransferase [Lecanosticta acicola]
MAQSIGSSSSIAKGHNAYVPGYKANHIKNHTWRTAENSAAYLLPKLQEMAREKPNLQLLDCGAGPGTITTSLAKYMPEGQVTATDLSEEVIHRAAECAKSQGVTNMKCHAANVYNLPFEDDSFDIVHTQQMLCHLDSPLEAIQSMLRVCRPGGILAIRECDMRMWALYPEVPVLQEFHKLVMATMKANGGSNDMGVRLLSLAMKAGLPRERIQASMGTWCYSLREEREVWGGAMRDRIREGPMRQKCLDQNLGWNAEEMDRMADAWEEWIETEDACFGCMHGEVIITK